MDAETKMLLMAQRSRQAYLEGTRPVSTEGMPEVAVTERQIATSAGQTRVLIYKPKKSKEKKLPVFVNIHGGGFIQGSAEDDEVWCRNIVEAVGCSVVSIDYHLSPEYKFPVALEECYDVLRWAHDQAGELGFDSARIAVGGHSAGGNFAAALCLMTRDRQEFPIIYQILNYPPLDFSADPFLILARDTVLTAKAQAFFTACYLPGKSAQTHPLASPLLAENFAGLPPALIIAAEYDPLRAENEKYAKRLEEAGVAVTFKVFEGCMHAFTHFGQEPAASEAWALVHEKLRQAFAPSV